MEVEKGEVQGPGDIEGAKGKDWEGGRAGRREDVRWCLSEGRREWWFCQMLGMIEEGLFEIGRGSGGGGGAARMW